MSSQLGIIGFPIGHSISPVFQQAALDHCGIDATYQAWEVSPEQVGDFVKDLRRPEVLGINVTVPHKEAVIPYLDEVDDWATEAGAVNTIVNHDGRLSGPHLKRRCALVYQHLNSAQNASPQEVRERLHTEVYVTQLEISVG